MDSLDRNVDYLKENKIRKKCIPICKIYMWSAETNICFRVIKCIRDP